MTEGKHTFTKTGRRRQASYATICKWVMEILMYKIDPFIDIASYNLVCLVVQKNPKNGSLFILTLNFGLLTYAPGLEN